MKMRAYSLGLALVIVLLLAVPQGESALRASIVTERVTVNGVTLNSFNAEFPLLRHREMYYLPMTYQLAAHLGLSTHFSPATGLHITRTGGMAEFVPDETAFNRRALVPVSLATHRVWVNGRAVEPAREPWPLLLYRGVTYFPLTERFARQEFGWTVQHDRERGLSISSVNGAREAEADIINILNRAYFTPRSFLGSLEDLSDGRIAFFAATTEVSHRLSREPSAEETRVLVKVSPNVFTSAELHAAPIEAVADFSGAHGESHRIGEIFRVLLPMGGRLMRGYMFAHSEKAYMLRAFLRLRFVGQERQRIITATRISAPGPLETWELNVHLPDEGFYARPRIFVVRATILVDTLRGTIENTVLENHRYRLRFSTVGTSP